MGFMQSLALGKKMITNDSPGGDTGGTWQEDDHVATRNSSRSNLLRHLHRVAQEQGNSERNDTGTVTRLY